MQSVGKGKNKNGNWGIFVLTSGVKVGKLVDGVVGNAWGCTLGSPRAGGGVFLRRLVGLPVAGKGGDRFKINRRFQLAPR
jgi:hypothetical protein